MKIYIDTNDRWVGWYIGEDHHYILLLPCVVIRINRKRGDDICPHCGHEWDFHDVSLPHGDDYSCKKVIEPNYMGGHCDCEKYRDDE